MLEAYTTLGFLAARSSRVRLGTAVSAVTFRPPTLLIKAVSTLDVLSGGRARLGLGAGYHAQEATDMGLPLPPVRERFEHLEDTLRLAVQMFDGDESPFAGTHHRLARPINSPRPRRRPSILVGGSGEQRTLRLVAQVRRRVQPVRHPGRRRDDHPQAGRAGRALHRRRTGLLGDREDGVHPAGRRTSRPSEFVQRCRALAALGIEHALVLVAGPWTDTALATLAAARPALDEIAAG